MHLADVLQPCQVDAIIATAQAAAPKLQAIIGKVIEQLPSEGDMFSRFDSRASHE
jgi:hypothetical protein